MDLQKLGVIGSPISHSKSPALHRAAYAVLGLSWKYDAYEVAEELLPTFMAKLNDGGWKGISVTMPLKETVIPYLDSVDDIAALTGAVNTIQMDDSCRRSGSNTDVYGITEALTQAGFQAAHNVLILGAGATARSAIVAAAQLGADQVDVVMRDTRKAGMVETVAQRLGLKCRIRAFTDVSVSSVEPELTISTLPGNAYEVAAALVGSSAARSSALLDVAYSQPAGGLAGDWSANGNLVISGTDMLLHQAIAQIRIFVQGNPLTPMPHEGKVIEAMKLALG